MAQRIGPGEQRALIAHELGHILSDHMVYMTALNILLSAGGNLPFFLGMPFRAVTAVLLEWFRAAELSCDRAAALAVRDPQIVCRLLMVLSGGMPASDLNLDAFMAQAMDYQAWDDPSDRVRRFFNELGKTHPDSVRRVSEVLKWVQSGEYDRIIRGEYRTRDAGRARQRPRRGRRRGRVLRRALPHDVPRDRRQPEQGPAPRSAAWPSNSPNGSGRATAATRQATTAAPPAAPGRAVAGTCITYKYGGECRPRCVTHAPLRDAPRPGAGADACITHGGIAGAMALPRRPPFAAPRATANVRRRTS